MNAHQVDTVVIGCGNPAAGDDAVGLSVIRSLQKRQLPAGVQVIEAGCPGLGILNLWTGMAKVIIVDAVQSGAPPGTIHCFPADQLPPREFLPVSTHGLNLLDAIELGRRLGKLPARLLIVGIEILDDTPFRMSLSTPVAAAIALAGDRVLAELEK